MMKPRQKARKKRKSLGDAGAAAAGESKRVIICPKCLDTKVIPHYKDTKHKIEHGDPLEAYYSKRACVNCGYVGYFFPEVPLKNLKKIRAEIRRLRK